MNLIKKIDLYLNEFNPNALKKPWTDTLNAQKQLRKDKRALEKKYKDMSPEEHKEMGRKLGKRVPNFEAEWHKSEGKRKEKKKQEKSK